MKAKTYKSNNNWTSPQSLSTFGIPLHVNGETKYLGLEEFNFCEVMLNFRTPGNQRVAYIPCFSVARPGLVVDAIDLFYHTGVPGRTNKYATIYEVSQIPQKDIAHLRELLTQVGLPQYVATCNPFGPQNNPPMAIAAINAWNKCFAQNNIVAGGTDPRFAFNIYYKRIEFHTPHVEVPWAHLNFANPLYN